MRTRYFVVLFNGSVTHRSHISGVVIANTSEEANAMLLEKTDGWLREIVEVIKSEPINQTTKPAGVQYCFEF